MIDVDLSVIQIDPRPVGGLKGVLATVADYYGMAPAEFFSASRKHEVAHARQAFMWTARQVRWLDGRYRYSLPQIGSFLGLDHTTILHGVRQHEKRLAETDPQAQQQSGDGLRITLQHEPEAVRG